MKALRSIVLRIFGALGIGRPESRVNEEMRHHLDLLAEEHERHGLSPEEARQAAQRDFGNLVQLRETHREQRGLPFLDTLRQDVLYALRMWRRNPGFSAVVVIILAVGIGANSAMFTFVNALLFRPMAGHAGELVGVYSHNRTRADSFRSFSYPNYLDIRDRSDVFDGLLAHTFALVGFPAGDMTRRAFIEVVSSNYFETIGVQLAAGRPFSAEEERPGANIRVAITGYDRWRDSGFSSSFIGSTVRINTEDFTVIGVAPPRFSGTTAFVSPEMWVPLGTFDTIVNDIFKNNGAGLGSRSNQGLVVAGRLRKGIDVDSANLRLDALSKQLEEAYPADNREQLLTVHPLSRVSISTEPASDAGVAILSAVIMPLSGAVLLIACFNIANMFLARGSSRKKELAIRLAVGGGRRRIVRQLVTEAFMLALAGAGVGLLLGYATMNIVVSSLTAIMPLPVQMEARPDLNVMLVTAGFAILSTFVFGLVPALKLSKRDVVSDLKESADAFGGRSGGIRTWLVVGQIAVCLMLMVAGGLFARVAVQAAGADPGYRYDDLFLVTVDSGLAGYDEAHGRTLMRDVLDRFRSIPGVEAAGMNSQVPFGEFHEGQPVARLGADATPQSVTFTIASSDYFKTLGMPLLRGREFTSAEDLSAAQVAVIDEPLARLLFGNEDPLGQMIRMVDRSEGLGPREHTVPREIVGVVPGIRDEVTDENPRPHLYVPAGSSYRASMNFYLRSRAGASESEMLNTIRREVRAADPKLPVLDLLTMRAFHERGLVLWALRAAGRTLSTFGILALVLATIGVYGLKSYLVSRRTREIGIRIALGARPEDILWLVLRDGARTTITGLLIGFPLAIGLAMLLRGGFVGVRVLDPLVMLLAPALLLGAAAVATYVPARRATRVTPLDALRME